MNVVYSLNAAYFSSHVYGNWKLNEKLFVIVNFILDHIMSSRAEFDDKDGIMVYNTLCF
jgi:hypothetical protein